VLSRECDLKLGGEWGREAGEDFQWRTAQIVLKQHITVRKCAFTTLRATVPSGSSATPITT
jgi:hypothetical protein